MGLKPKSVWHQTATCLEAVQLWDLMEELLALEEVFEKLLVKCKSKVMEITAKELEIAREKEALAEHSKSIQDERLKLFKAIQQVDRLSEGFFKNNAPIALPKACEQPHEVELGPTETTPLPSPPDAPISSTISPPKKTKAPPPECRNTDYQMPPPPGTGISPMQGSWQTAALDAQLVTSAVHSEHMEYMYSSVPVSSVPVPVKTPPGKSRSATGMPTTVIPVKTPPAQKAKPPPPPVPADVK